MTARGRGFTLVEIVVVLAILALSAAVAVPAYSAMTSHSTPRDAVAQVTALLERARAQALARGRETRLTIDPEHARIWWQAPDSTFVLPLPADCQLTAEHARAHIRFAADGSAIADALGVRCDGGQVAVAVDPWTGATHLTESR